MSELLIVYRNGKKPKGEEDISEMQSTMGVGVSIL